MVTKDASHAKPTVETVVVRHVGAYRHRPPMDLSRSWIHGAEGMLALFPTRNLFIQNRPPREKSLPVAA